MDPACTGSGGEIFAYDSARVRGGELDSLLRVQIERNLHSLLGEPIRVDIFGSLEHLVNGSAAGSHQLQQAKHCHTVIAIWKEGGIVAAGTIDSRGDLLHPRL